MFNGIEFHDATNALICGNADFTTSWINAEGRREEKRYRLYMHPDGWQLQRQVPYYERATEAAEWETIKYHAKPEDVVPLLPKVGNFEWTWSTFLLALSFWGDGHKAGTEEVHNEWERVEYQRRQKEKAAAQTSGGTNE